MNLTLTNKRGPWIWGFGVIPDDVDNGLADFDVLWDDEEPEVEDVAEQGPVDQDPKRVKRDSAKEKSRC